VKGDLRSYERPVVIWGEVEHDRAVDLAGRIYQEVPGVNRCVLDCTGKGFRDVTLHPATVTRERLNLLREADALAMEALERYGLMRTVWQCPTVLVPLEVNGGGRELVVLRPVLSERAMTARPAPLPREMIRELAASMTALQGVSGLVLDVTTKPPGTIEWE
jgi:GMP synthase (glutamine-hydrolysing)